MVCILETLETLEIVPGNFGTIRFCFKISGKSGLMKSAAKMTVSML